MLRQLQEQSRWLSRHASNVTSQFGEDGIVARALSLLPERNFWCVEFGAWDGKHLSNTYDLIASQNYRGVFIEPDPVRFRELERMHGASGRNILVNAFVGFTMLDCLDVLLAPHEIPKNFDFLSIDIDGNDYHVWEAIAEYVPALVMIEFNPTFCNEAIFVQKRDPETRHGSSPASIVDLAARKGYELIAATEVNLLFVRREHYAAFGIADNSLALIRDESGIPRLFVGYDGHVFLSQAKEFGAVEMPWHGIELHESDVQALPAFLQKYPEQYTRSERFLFRLKSGFRRPRRFLRGFLLPWRKNPGGKQKL